MKFYSVAAAAILAGLASAQSLTGLPVCAESCVVNAIPQSCNLAPACICASSAFIEAITCCVYKACNATEQAATIKYADGICNPVGVTNLPTAASCPATSNSTAAATSMSSSATSSASMTSAVSSSAASSISSAVSSLASVASSAASSASSAAASATSNAAAALWVQGLGAVGAAVAGAAALI